MDRHADLILFSFTRRGRGCAFVVEAVPFLYLVPLLFLILSLITTASETYLHHRHQKTSLEGGKSSQTTSTKKASGWIIEGVIHFWPKKLDEAEKREALSRQKGLFSIIWGSKELGPLTLYFNFPSSEPNPQSITWACTSFLGAALNSKSVVQWCGGDGLKLSFLRGVFTSIQFLYGVDHVLSLFSWNDQAGESIRRILFESMPFCPLRVPESLH